MRIPHLVPSVLLAIFVSAAAAHPSSKLESEKANNALTNHEPNSGNSPPAVTNPPTNAQARGLGDSPIDGNDGKPHAGPFVETSAERDRKKAAQGKLGKPKTDPEDLPSKHVLPGGQPLPHSHDGVMDDKNRPGPKEGTTGTEGGVSEKSKEQQPGQEKKKPDPPKDIPPLPHSEQQKIPDQDGEKVGLEGSKMLEKPVDLPDSPHALPPPSPPGHSDKPLDDPLRTTPSTLDTNPLISKTNEIIQPFHSFVLSLTMILFSEVGDKTFLVAALMAMRHPRTVVFSAAFSALITMTVLSALLGHAVPTILPESYTHALAALLFFVFGIKMMIEARNMAPDESVSQEMKEVEMELEEKEHQQRRMSRRRSSVSPYALESGHVGRVRKHRTSNARLSSPESLSPSSSRENSPSRNNTLKNISHGINNLLSLLLSPAWVQTFVMTFLGEWGDRSQIATIAMAAGPDFWWVTCGAILGHGFCTGAAVLGGRAVAGKVSMRIITFGGACTFLLFAFLYLIESIY
ncbi:hypothetical protein FQN57_006467 [Myotisia sp. PD_48]|nr:hypothetical protein FQN57_006467 [Myotisia sp. PD_48]